MISFILRRLILLVPAVFGISLATFVLVNLAIDNSNATKSNFIVSADQKTTQEFGRAYGLHLPLFLNFSIEDVKTRSNKYIAQLSVTAKRKQATRSLIRTGGAVIPYLVPVLSELKGEAKVAALKVMENIAKTTGFFNDLENARTSIQRLNHKKQLSNEERTSQILHLEEAFWTKNWNYYGSDFTSIRSNRLVRRYVRRNDLLALAELKQLNTFCLPELMQAMEEDMPPDAIIRIVNLSAHLAKRNDPINTNMSTEQRNIVIARWKEWWNQRYDLYTSFEGIRRITGTITETRYFHWLSRIITFDFGVSTRDGRPVRAKIAKRLPVTLLLSFLALFAAYLVAIPLGVLSAVKRGSLFDKITTVALFVIYSLPAFWVAMLLLRYLGGSGYLNWFPSQGLTSSDTTNWPLWRRVFDVAHHLVLPVLCLSFVSMAMLARFQRVGMLGIMEQDFIRTAKAKGLSSTKIILKHGLRNGVIPLITMMGLQLPYLVSGSVIIEKIFGIQGMGLETFEAIRSSDHVWLMSVITVTAILTMIGILAADVIYAIVDPRIVPGRRIGRSS